MLTVKSQQPHDLQSRKARIFTLEVYQRCRNFPNQKPTWSKCSKGTNFQSPWTLRGSHAPTLGHVHGNCGDLWLWKCGKLVKRSGNFLCNLGFGEHLGSRNDDQSTKLYETVVFKWIFWGEKKGEIKILGCTSKHIMDPSCTSTPRLSVDWK